MNDIDELKTTAKVMRPTAKMRWLEVGMSELGPTHPSAILVSGTNRARVLQQWCEREEGGSGEWRDINIEG